MQVRTYVILTLTAFVVYNYFHTFSREITQGLILGVLFLDFQGQL